MQRTSAKGSAASFCRAVELVLTPLGNAERAAGMQAYMRGQFHYLGLSAPELRRAGAPLIRSFEPATPTHLRAAADALWRMREREFQYVAIGLLAHHAAALSVTDLEWVLELAQQKPWWDTVDSLAKVVGRVVRNEKSKGQKLMDRAVRADDLWVRRIAMIHQLGWRGDTDTARLFSYAKRLAPETEFFIRKAIGWALREHAKHDWRAVEEFLLAEGDRIPNLSRREASKHFEEYRKRDGANAS